MFYKKLLGKNIGATYTPMINSGTLTNRRTKVDMVLSISDNTILGRKGCYLIFNKTKANFKIGDEIHAIKISKKEAHKLLKSELTYKQWRHK